MKIFFMDLNTIGNEDVLDALSRMQDQDGRLVETLRYPFENTEKRRDPVFEKKFSADLERDMPDAVFSFNYFPLVSTVCNQTRTPYIAFVYDSPHISLYSYTTIYPCNHIYVFDSKVAEIFNRAGIKTVQYLPLAVSTRRLDGMVPNGRAHKKFDADIAFVGGLYTEAHTFYDRMEPLLDDYTHGYLEGLMAAQLQVSGLNFVEACLTPSIVERMEAAYPMPPNADGVETSSWIYAQYMMNRKITQTERTMFLERMGRQFGEKYDVALYTRDPNFSAPGIQNRGRIDYYDEMPYAFKCAKINLNITLRSIERGIPQRALDIMAAGGFLLTNYQADFSDFFTADEDFVYYEGEEDLFAKIGYYLEHDEERKAIAKSGHDKMTAWHTWDIRLKQIMDDVFGGANE